MDSVAVIHDRCAPRPREWIIATGFHECGFSERRLASWDVMSPEAGEVETGRWK